MYECVIPTESFRNLHSGNPAEAFLRRYHAVVPIESIPEEWSNWLEVNARDSSEKGKVPNAIRTTLSDKPEWFAAYNRGLTLVAIAIDFDTKTKLLKIRFDDPLYHGVLDGGHTLRAILDHRQDSDEEGQVGFCNVEIFTGLDDSEIPSVVEARNTSKQVASKSLMNLSGAFDSLAAAIGSSKAKLISWKENDEGIFDVRELIGLLTALDPTWTSENTQPVIAYSGKEACLKRFRENSATYEKLFGIAGDALEIWEAIQYWLPGQYNQRGVDPGAYGRFGGLYGVKYTPGKTKSLAFINKSTEYHTPTGYIYPVLSAFRAMLVEQNGQWTWGKGIRPLDLIRDGVAAEIFVSSVRESIRNYRNPNRTGKDTQAWTSAYQAARIMFLEHEAPVST